MLKEIFDIHEGARRKLIYSFSAQAMPLLFLTITLRNRLLSDLFYSSLALY